MPPSSLHVEAVRRFNRLYTRRIGVLPEGYLGTPYTLAEARVLYELAQGADPCGNATATTLGRALGLDLGYLSRLLQGLRRRGLVQARRSPVDGRQALLALTEKGHRAFAALNHRSREEIGALLSEVPGNEHARLVGAMGEIERLLEGRAAPIVLRGHRPGDMGWVLEAHARIYWEEYGWGARFEALVAGILQEFLERYDPSRERCWIAALDGRRAGSAFVLAQSRRVAKVRLLAVEPFARGRGLGKRLVDECIAFARDKGYRKLVLWTHANLAAARGIYAAAGFRRVKSEPHSRFGPRVTGEYWELDLS